jgi:hypothetical protein
MEIIHFCSITTCLRLPLYLLEAIADHAQDESAGQRWDS